jgi:hypothetical protein
MGQRHRGGKSLKRVTGRRPELRTIVAFCEGKKSEPDYINGLKRLPHLTERTALNLEIHPLQGVPLTLVQMAVKRKKDTEVDECWCLFDVEYPRNHPNLQQAVDLARAHGIKLAISNPCFEVWLILHHEDFTSFASTETVERKSRSLDGRTGKGIDATVYMPRRKDAVHRAKQLSARHRRDHTKFPDDNPSSGMPGFLEALGDALGDS